MKLIASLIVFYPLIIPVWQNEPLSDKNTKLPERVNYMEKNQVQWQIDRLNSIKDDRIKSRIIFDLSKSNNPGSVNQLKNLLKNTSEKVKTDILFTLYNMREIEKTGNMSLFPELMKSKNQQIKTYSSALYLDNSGDPNEVLKIIDSGCSNFFLNFIEKELIKKADLCDKNLIAKLLKSENINKVALSANLLASQREDPDNSTILKRLAGSRELIIRVAIAKGLSSRDSGGIRLLQKLSEDNSPTVRCYVASSKKSEEILSVLIKLTVDSDFEVRRLAALSLGNYADTRASMTLIKLLSDKAPEVRKAAADSIIKISPEKDLLKVIGEKSLHSERSRPYAIRILGELKDKSFAKDINDYLGSTEDDEIILHSIMALDSFEYKSGEKNIRAKANHPDLKIRKAVAHALGTLALKDSFETLIHLSKDRRTTNEVSTEAIKSMGRIGDPYFNKRLNDILHELLNSLSHQRSYAYWSVARINKPTEEMLKVMEGIALKKIVKVPMGEPEFDKNFTRISVCLALIDMSKKHPELKEKASIIVQKLSSFDKNKFGEEISNPTLREFARQAKLYMDGNSNIKPVPLPTRRYPLTVKPIK